MLLYSSAYFFSVLCFHQQQLVLNIYFHYFFNVPIYCFDNKVQRHFYTIHCHMSIVVNNNIFVWFSRFFMILMIGSRFFCIIHVFKKVVRTIFNISSFSTINFYVNMICIYFWTNVLYNSNQSSSFDVCAIALLHLMHVKNSMSHLYLWHL